MEAAVSIILATILLAGGGTAGAFFVTDGQDWMGSHHGDMMGSNGDGDVDCPGSDVGHPGDCHGYWADHPDECEEHLEEDCPYHQGETSS